MATLPPHSAPHAQALAEALATELAARLDAALQARGQAVLAVSGGKSPIALFQALRACELDWSRITVTLVDERAVPRDHADSNAALVREHLLQGLAQRANFVPLVDEPHLPLPDAVTLLARAQARWQSLPHADVTVLGMGEDGHTASLFPGTSSLAQGLAPDNRQRLLSVQPLHAPHARISMTLAEILASRHIAIALGGPNKQAVFEQAQAGLNDALPISHVIHADHPSIAVWSHT